MRRGRPDGQRGFSLLEVMVALAILAMTLTVLLEIVTNNVRATNHAKLTTTATFLARGKIVQLEDYVIEKGFVETTETQNGTFKEEGFPSFRWDYVIERVELPTEATQQAQQAASSSSGSKDPMQAMTGMLGGLMSGFVEPIRIGLQESVRKVTLRVAWDEAARPEQVIEIVTYLTDPAKLDMAMAAAPGAMPGGMPGATPGSTPGTPGATPGIPGMPGGIPGIPGISGPAGRGWMPR